MVPIPTVHFGTLEDMLAELQEGVQGGKTCQIRVSAHSRTRTNPLGGEKTNALVVVTSLLTDAFPNSCTHQYGLWVWHIGSYSHKRAGETNAWTMPELDTLVEHLLRAVHQAIKQEFGIFPKTGMYSVDPEWFDTPGNTKLLDLSLYRSLIKPPAGVQIMPITTSQTLVLGCLSNGSFQEAADSRLTSDDRISLVSPDLTSCWLRLPVGYDQAIAAKEERMNATPSYTIIYNPEATTQGQ